MSDDEVEFLTQKDPKNEDVIMSLWHDKLKMLLITDGEKGCRYVTKVMYCPSNPCFENSSFYFWLNRLIKAYFLN